MGLQIFLDIGLSDLQHLVADIDSFHLFEVIAEAE